MTNAEILAKLEQVRDNTLNALVCSTPGTEEHTKLLYAVDQVLCMVERFEYRVDEPGPVGVDDSDNPGEPGEEGDTETPEPDVKGEKGDSPGDPGPEREPIVPEDLRAELAEAKKKGVVISDLINSLGAKNFSALKDDQDKLHQLKELMEKALKELGV